MVETNAFAQSCKKSRVYDLSTKHGADNSRLWLRGSHHFEMNMLRLYIAMTVTTRPHKINHNACVIIRLYHLVMLNI